MAGISVTGVGSGIDINSLVEQLVAAERQPTQRRLDIREVGLQAELSGFGLVKSALSELQGRLSTLGEEALFQGRTATSSEPDVFTASAESGAASGTFSLEVEQLASAQKLRSTGFSSADSTVGGGSLTIVAGSEGFTVDVGAGASLAAIRDAINQAPANTAVSAGIVNVDDGSGGTESRLVLTAREPGSANALTVTTADADGNDTDAAGLSQLVYDPDGSGATNLVELDAAADAIVYLDGQQATRSSNQIDDLIDGVTVDLVKADPGTAHTLTVAEGTADAAAAVQAFVKAFNAFIDTFNGQTAYNPDTGEAGPLLGDSTVRILESRLRGSVTSPVAGVGNADSLAAIGILTDDSGRLTVDQAALNNALAGNPGSVSALFAGDDGIVARTEELISGYLQNNGLLDARIDGVNARIEGINADREALNDRVAALESRLLAQFTAMDQLVAELQSTGNFLTQQLANIPVPGRDNN